MLSQYYTSLFRLTWIEYFSEYFFMPLETSRIDFKCGTVVFNEKQLFTFIEFDYLPKYADFLLNLNR